MQLGKYELLETLGKGGYGAVYRARDTVLDVIRAVKVLHPPLAADGEFLARFQQEARLAARLEHPHIVPVYDLAEDAGRFYLAMLYLPGGSLKELLAKQGRLPFARTLEITRQIAAALDFAYQRPEKLIHRDVKPGNILFDADGTARLADFGFAKALAAAASVSHSSSGGLTGTPAYMPPEVWRGKGVGPAADVYSLACVFYEMLTGSVLFAGDSPPEVMTRHVMDGAQFPQTWPPGVPPGVEAALRRALAKDPAVRPGSAGELASLLAESGEQRTESSVRYPARRDVPPERLLTPAAAPPTGSAPDVRPPSPPGRAAGGEGQKRKPSRWLPWLILAAFGLFLVILAGGAGLFDFLLGLIIQTPVAPTQAAPTQADPPQCTTIGQTWVSPLDGMTLVCVPAGEFWMGSADSDADAASDEKPQHPVYLDAYWMDRTEVTYAQYQLFMSQTGYSASPCGEGDRPAVCVSWYDANAYCQWAGRELPSEAQWEKAARGTDGRLYPWGDAAPESTFLNYNVEIGNTTAVGSYPSGASPYGALDMAGNVWEWVADWYDGSYYSSSPADNPTGPASGEGRVLRGGSWGYGAGDVRAANRNRSYPVYRGDVVGFRCSR